MTVDSDRLREEVSRAVALSLLIAHHDPRAARDLRNALVTIIGGPRCLVPTAYMGDLSCRALLEATHEACVTALELIDNSEASIAQLGAGVRAGIAIKRLVASFDAPAVPQPSLPVDVRVNVRHTGVA